jgi:3-phenylpropionate/cinnamic acid dioxygenase small subunit
MADRIAQLERRLLELEDREGIRDAISRFAHALDYGPAEAWADCFTEDGVFDIRTRRGLPSYNEYPTVNRGRDALLRLAHAHPVAPDEYHKHLTLMPEYIEITGDVAKVKSFFVVIHEIKGPPETVHSGTYDDEFVRCPDGRWRLRQRVVEVTGSPGPLKQWLGQ